MSIAIDGAFDEVLKLTCEQRTFSNIAILLSTVYERKKLQIFILSEFIDHEKHQ